MVLPVSLERRAPKEMKPWNAVIVGGGPAGSASAAELARNGQRVLLLEKERFPHHKICGEFLSGDAVGYLDRAGVDLIGLGAQPITTIRVSRGKRSVAAPLPFTGLSISRFTLDEVMLSKASGAGAVIRRGVDVMAIENSGGKWLVTIKDGEEIPADTIFLATGKHNVRGWRRVGGIEKDVIGFKMHYRLSERQKNLLAGTVELNLFDAGYAGLEPIESGLANLCLVVAKEQYLSLGKRWEFFLGSLLEKSPALAERLTGAIPCWHRPLSISQIPYGFLFNDRSDELADLYRLGDQIAVIPSFTGYGLSIALHTATTAVDCYLHSGSDEYYSSINRTLRPLLRSASFLSRATEYSLAQETFMVSCSIWPRLLTEMASRGRINLSGARRPRLDPFVRPRPA
jgi:menaquinone-9 beta-reductase